MKLSIILGTRPEIIKMSPLIRECEKRNLDYFVLHTGQHYSYEMDRAFFDDLELPKPAYNLDVGSGSHAEQTGKIMEGIEKVILEEKPDVVLVQGDTNTVLAGALAASKVHIKVGHVEAGLRSYDRSMPEEINRVVVDHVSDYLFAPTELSKQNLLKEGIEESKIFVTGNTIVDAIFQNLEISNKKVDVLNDLGLKSKEYFLLTSHRAENVDSREQLGKLLKGISTIQKEYSLPVVFPIHPRTEKKIKEFGFSLDGIRPIKPVGFLEFLQLEANARLVFTDSGGVQEETCILGTPCVTLRDNTERPETLEVGSNVLAGVEPDRIIQSAIKMMSEKRSWINPFGDGRAAEKIIDTLRTE
ncbi:UDP-N-acetylglucosamine 2-epimerase [Methanosarcina sp. 2.H.T.1A.6]|uniref:non-hydrolyzing UDP-N-acetylglucosamine 2-epimerase n=1 Tax=unclassified Methanosarcina TaxID=2644672 RepID=UPI0006220B29|nr:MULTISPECIES: UDP-N-acetylglucosamine 2-epimerase (non-hydrolyzing) [unclassified Methanosarcina]KKG13328.1 UDP-N-acetylglucosamine 2-epimerase [Methanosarcina sp. 2.H.T.1A.15]KKG16642.1 UDP-N-acetylglucosamine 2-epimerase [Methanosarcina sp. 2.H.T.1A.3]KKG21237.1 UDP-N-acetylglucosamine 2-epimerase [Methanosarcina sp. 2.H.T.1A.8]KKG25245.1 UDP-N-acetylglucosamine 2-epimerase [Methanosarcina sp. 2.H.T.1A.6]